MGRLARLNAASATHEGGTGTGVVHCGDARELTQLIPAELDGEVDLVVTSPPYGNSVHGQVRSARETGERGVVKKDYRYSHDPSNLAHVSTDRLLDAFTEILSQCRRVLRPSGTGVVTTRPWREHGELIDLPSAVLAAGQVAGLAPAERCVALLAGIRDSRLIARPSFPQMKNVRDDPRGRSTARAHRRARPEPPAHRHPPWPSNRVPAPGRAAVAATDLTIGSLFSGVGGLDLGVQAALGGHVAWHAETDPHAVHVITKPWPQVPQPGERPNH